jgi:hypothetical protein
MITAEKLALLTKMPTFMLENSLPEKARVRIYTARFLGITNGGEFCYSVSLANEVQGKVFLRYDPAVDQVTGTLG